MTVYTWVSGAACRASCASSARVGACLVLFVASLVPAQTSYTPPAGSAAAVSGVEFGSSQPLTALQGRFTGCDRTDMCDGKKLKSPFQCSTDPSRNTALLKLKSGVLFFDGKMAIDADGSQLSKARGGTNLPETAWHYPTPPRQSVDAEHVPYLVLPLEFVSPKYAGLREAVRVRTGDIAAVVHDGQTSYAIFADTGPACKLGEGSMKLHDELGNKACAVSDANGVCTRASNHGIGKDVLFFVFPDSAKLISTGLTPANVNERLLEQGPKLMQALKSGAVPPTGAH